MKIVIDTNVLVSAALRDRDPEAVILFVLEQEAYQWLVSSAILEEYKTVLCRKRLGLSEALKQQWFHLLETLTTLVEVDLEIEFPRDQKDAKFIACALAANAEVFITGDKDFTEAQRLLSTTIVSISQFKQLIIDTAT
ncbi:putative toxin-antitoxin system toxin component, PIN family [Leptolyngbya sp. 'hensonii']|uniref:putative toxin-antitoxin system toxin component, PIN family n=1 Tax=Leptolyngbya sp. 'hensonii' TaxID=1922337 RepID=UPI0009501B3F|nr:putative toxin-antitoxin system toxin component, PIN family [Leptolyngbya sp. 'hensonii']OLP20101.1 putative toxin-antitoxin system toxin component, PIN family [Leptolyngbya sp. 'hensonii']